MPNSLDREAFEKWYAKTYPNRTREYTFDFDLDQRYAGLNVEESWQGWQAGAAAEREICAKLCESLWRIDGQFTADEFANEIRDRGTP